MVYTKCLVYGCKSATYNNKDVRFYRLPALEERRLLWLRACKRLDLVGRNDKYLSSKYVCSLHFEQNMYSKKNLKKTASPTLKLPKTPTLSVQTQTEVRDVDAAPSINNTVPDRKHNNVPSMIESCLKTNRDDELPSTSLTDTSTQTRTLTDYNPRKRHLRKLLQHSVKKIKQLKRKHEILTENITRKQFFKGCYKFLNPEMCGIVKAQVNLQCKPIEKRYTLDFKQFCLTLFQTSPNNYRFLSKTKLLPSTKILSKMYIPITTKLNQQVLNILSASMKHKTELERECVLCVDEMSVKCSLFYGTKQDRVIGLHEINGKQEPYAAGYAFTVMLRGITSEWKQLVGFSFTSTSQINNDLEDWITSTINQLLDIGLKVRGVASNLGIDFQLYSKKNYITRHKSFFHVDRNKMYYIYDIPYIIKSVRDNLMKFNFHFNDKIASWDDIEAMFKLDKTKNVRLVPRLNEVHLSPNNFQRERIRFAAQVFSNSVVAALNVYSNSQEIEPCDGTIEFVQLMTDVFATLYSDDPFSAKPNNKPFKGDDYETKVMNQVREMLLNLKIIDKISGEDVTDMVEFVDPFIISINSIIHLVEDLKKDNVEYLLTRQLNSDALESFFRTVRQAAGRCWEPTCIQFTRAFRKMFLFQVIKLAENTNLVGDSDKMIAEYDTFCNTESLFVENNTDKDINDDQESSELIQHILDIKFNRPEHDTFTYMCGYLWRRIAEQHDCISIKSSSSADEPVQEPPSDFVDYCHSLECVFRQIFLNNIGDNIGLCIQNGLEEVHFVPPCDCFPNTYYILKQFVSARIKYYVEYHNRELSRSKYKCRKRLVVAHL